jgi:hypothetical protein
MLIATTSFAQGPGDDVFATDQILKVELTFSQPGFWDSLVANYSTETYMMADVVITDNTGMHSYDEIAIRLKGNSSYGHPGDKKSFKIDFNRYNDTMDYDKMEKLNFNNCFKDPTFIREKLIYDICHNAGVPAPRCVFADVYMNGTYWGFYDVVEQIDDDFLDAHFDNSSENLFKAGAAFGVGTDAADLIHYGDDTTAYENRYSLENNENENNWSDLIALTDFISNSSDVTFADSLQFYFNVPVLMKSLVLDNMFSNLDSYTNSARNYYIYHNPVNGLWEWIKWDCNEAFGSYPAGGGMGGGVTDMTTLETDYYAISRPLLERIVTIEATRATYDYYYCEMKNNYFSNTYLDPKIDALDDLIREAVLADDNKMYTDAQYIENLENDITTGGGPGGGTVYGLKSFVAERADYLDAVIDCSNIGQSIESDAAQSIFVFPNPTFDEVLFTTNFNAEGIALLYDINGALLQEIQINNTATNISLRNYQAGIYVLKINTSDAFATTLIVKR